MHSVRIEPTKLVLVTTRITYQATGAEGPNPSWDQIGVDQSAEREQGARRGCVLTNEISRYMKYSTNQVTECHLRASRKHYVRTDIVSRRSSITGLNCRTPDMV